MILKEDAIIKLYLENIKLRALIEYLHGHEPGEPPIRDTIQKPKVPLRQKIGNFAKKVDNKILDTNVKYGPKIMTTAAANVNAAPISSGLASIGASALHGYGMLRSKMA
jgi:hypothetical protein